MPEELPVVCRGYLQAPDALPDLAERGFSLIRARSEARYLEAVLDQMAADGML